MVEIPAAALTAARLAPHVDFFSIGTNDLTQYTMAAERGDARLATLLDGPQPAVLRLVHETVRAATAHDRWVGVCGELAGDPAAAVLLAGLGVTELSMAPGLIAAVKQALRSVSLADARDGGDHGARRRVGRRGARARPGPCCRTPVSCVARRRRSTNVRGMEAGSLNALRSSRVLAVGTSLRIAACPVIMALVLSRDDTIAAIVFLVAAATDWFDGRLARRWGVTTKLGSFLDTTADKLLVTTTLIALVAVHRASPWVTLVIVGREFTILGLRAAVAAGGVRVMETSMLGKWKATVQFVAIALAILRPDVTIAGAYLDQWAMVIAAVVTAWSGVDYLARSTDALRS